jgi:hypothetical protein
MAEWRIGRGWTEAELEQRLVGLPQRQRNFADPVEAMTLERGWNQYFSEAVVGREPPGPPVPDGPFTRGRVAVSAYAFSDPRIVIGHFDPDVPLLGRYMLLEMRALRVFHYLAGVVVAATRHDEAEGEAGPESVFGFRYDTLDGHIESGVEWFLLRKAHATGEIRFRIEAAWRPGQFPNWWSRLGFAYFGPRYQKRWHHRAHALLARLMRDPDVAAPEAEHGRLVHADPAVVFQRIRAHHV